MDKYTSTTAARFSIVLAGPLNSINTWSCLNAHSIEAQRQIVSTGQTFINFLSFISTCNDFQKI